MRIDRHNCEAFFLDYHEGTLSPVAAGEVLLFLEENPDLKELFEEYENISLEKENTPFPGKDTMGKKYSAEGIESLLSSEVTADNCDQFFIAFVEGQLSAERISRMNAFLENNPALKREFELFKRSRISAENISFEEKYSLKKYLITKENREEYFIRAAEKDLSPAEEEQLKLFIAKNPEYKKELGLFTKAVLPSEHMTFGRKELLKRTAITKENVEEYFIRSIEKDLSKSEEAQLAAFLQSNPEYKKEFALFSKAVLPVETIVFADKSSLKKKERKPVVVSIFSQRTAYYAAAAAILLLVGLFFVFRSDETSTTFVAETTSSQSAVSSPSVTVNPEESIGNDGQSSSAEAVAGKPATSNQKLAGSRQSAAFSLQSPSSASSFAKATADKKASAGKAVGSQQPATNDKKEKDLQPVILEDKETLLAEKEEPRLEMMKEEDVALKVNTITPPAPVSAMTAQKADEYQTIGSLARGKIRSALGIKGTECSTDDKLTVWDFAMAAKGGIQKLVGTKVDVNKVCNGDGEKVEYVFAAGNFEITKSMAR